MGLLVNRNWVANDLGLLLIRLIVGVVFMFHGAQKLFGWFDGPGIEGFAEVLQRLEIPQPEIMAWLTGIAEFGGGLLIFLGLLTRLAAIGPVIVMAVAVTKVHPHTFPVSADPPGMEFALTLGVVTLALIFTGGGRFSIDGLINAACCQKTHKPDRFETTTRPTTQAPPT